MDFSMPASSEARPPTPPKERATNQTLEGFIDFLDTSSRLQAPPLPELDTPPPSSSPLTSSPLKAGAKKIRFVAQPSLIGTPESDDYTHHHAPLRPLPPSRHQRSFRSILKACDTSSPIPSSDDADAYLGNASISDFNSFADMLEAVAKGLASTIYTSRIDAYQLLLKCFRAYRKVPDPQALLSQLPFFEDVIQRDMLAISSATQGPDAKLIGQATKVIANLMWDSKICVALSQTFIDAVMARCIAVAEAPKLPKEVVKNQLFLLTIDRFLARACSPSRAATILAALASIHDRVSGDHILAIRLLILQQFIRCAPATLTQQAKDWLPWVFHGIMSSSAEIRSVAITTGAMCSTALGSSRQITLAVREYFEQQALGAEKNFDQFYHRIEEMIQDTEDARRVPGIWSIVILLMRGGQHTLASWPRLNQWFKIIQTCLNKADNTLNLEAWVAWNNLIFAVNPGLATPSFLRKILIKPIIAKLQLHARTEPARRIRDAAFSSFTLLLYYTFRPGCSADHITLYWAEFVMEVVQNARMTSRRDFDRLCDILSAVLSNPEAGVWDIDRYAPSCTNPVKAVEIPQIDPAWTRANIDVATELVEHLVAMQLPLQGHHDFAQRIWKSLLRAVAEAGSREVKSSPALKRAVAEVLNLFSRLTERITVGNIRTASPDSALDCICDMADAIRCIEPSNFTEKCVTRAESGIYGVPQTPFKSRQDDGQLLQTPLTALLQMISPLAKAATPHSDGLQALDTLVSACVNSLSTRKAKLQLLKSCAKAVCGGPELNSGRFCQPSLWNCIASSVTSVLAIQASPVSLNDSGQQLYQDYQACLLVAKKGLDLTNTEDCDVLLRLVTAMIYTAQHEAGDAAALISIIAPLSLAVICCHPRDGLDAPLVVAFAMLDTQLSPPSDRTLKSAAKYLLPEGETMTNWSFALFNMTNRLLHEASKGASLQNTHLEIFFAVLTKFSKSALCSEPKELLIQCHIGLSRCAKNASKLASNFTQLWTSFMDILARQVTRDSRNLAVHEVLFIAGFTSDRRAIARITLDCWNSTFGSTDDIVYSDALKSHLDRLSNIAHVMRRSSDVDHQMTSVASQAADDGTIYPWVLQDADDDSQELNITFSSMPTMFPIHQHPIMAGVEQNSTTKPKSLPTKGPIKLRHDNSQIDFVPIESPLANASADESQNLTEHQKDVRSRQDLNGTLYAEMRSSPVSVSKELGRQTLATETLLPARVLDFGMQAQEATPDVHRSDGELDMSLIDDVYDIPMSPSQQRNERRVEQKGSTAIAKQAMDGSNMPVLNKVQSSNASLDDVQIHSDERSGEMLNNSTPSEFVEKSSTNAETNSSRLLQVDKQSQHNEQTRPDTNMQRGVPDRINEASADERTSLTVQDSFPALAKVSIQRVDDSFAGFIPPTKTPRVLRMTSERASRTGSGEDVHSVSAGSGTKKRKSTATQDLQRKKKSDATPSDDCASQISVGSNVSDNEIEVFVERPIEQAFAPLDKTTSRRGRPRLEEQRSSNISRSSDRQDTPPRRSDRHRKRSQMASSDDDNNSKERSSKAKKTTGLATASAVGQSPQRRRSVRQVDAFKSSAENDPVTGAAPATSSSRGRRSTGRGKRQPSRQSARQRFDDDDNKQHQIKEEFETRSSPSRVEASQVGPTDAAGTQEEEADDDAQDAADQNVDMDSEERNEEAHEEAIEPAEQVMAYGGSLLEQQASNEEGMATIGASSTPSRGAEAAIPTSPVFSPTMSEKAQAFINRMRDMYKQCKELVLGTEEQTIMDEMEDVHEILGKEIKRCLRLRYQQSGPEPLWKLSPDSSALHVSASACQLELPRMPTYLVHGFRWPRQSIHIHVILHHLDDAAANWTMAPQTTRVLLEDFIESFPEPMESLPNLRFVEEYDPRDPATKHSPYAYVGDIVEEIKLSYAVNEIIMAAAQAVSDEQLNALSRLRNELCPEAKIEWYIVVCGDVDRDFPPTPLTPPGDAHNGQADDRQWMESEYSPAPRKQKSRLRLNSIGRRKDKGHQSTDNLSSMTSTVSIDRRRKSSDSRPQSTASTAASNRRPGSNMDLDSERDYQSSPAPPIPRVKGAGWTPNYDGNGDSEPDRRQSRLKSALKRIF